LTNLSVFEADLNQLSGSIPALNNLPALYFFKVDHNQLSGPISSLAALTGLLIFQVQNNRLTGPAPIAPSPNQLTDGDSVLCPNPLTPTPASIWDAATGFAPWYSACDPIFKDGFEP